MTNRVLSVVIVGDSASAQRAFEKTGAAAMAASKEAEKSVSGFEKAGAKMSTFGSTVEKAGKKMTTHLTLPILAVGGAAVKMGLDFQKTMLLVETHTESSHKQVERYKKAILEMSASGKYTQGPKEFGEAMYHIASDGYHGQKALEALRESANLAMLGQSDLAETTYAVVSAMKTGIKGTQNLHETIGTLNGTMGAGDTKMGELTAAMSTGVIPAAKAAGLELTDVGAALAFMTARGIPAQKAAYGLAMNFQQIVPYTEKAKDATKRLGLGLTELGQVASRGPEGWLHAMEDLHEHLEGLNKFAQTQAIEEIFGGGRTSRGILAQQQNLGDLAATYERLGVIAGKTDKNLKTARESEANVWKEEWAKLQSAMVEMGNALTPVVIPIFKEVAGLVTGIAKDFNGLSDAEKGWVIKAGLAVAALGPMLTIGGNILKVFGAVETTIGKVGRGIGVLEAEQAVGGAGGIVPVGAGTKVAAAESAGVAESETASVSRWLGTESTNPVFGSFLWAGPTGGRALQKAGRETVKTPMLPISEADATTDALGLERAGTPAIASSFAGMGSRLARGAVTWGLGGVVVGQRVKEVGDSRTATAIGDALQGAGVGAAIGTAIAPGIGTALGAAVGGAGGAVASLFDNHDESQKQGEKYGEAFLQGWQKNIPNLRRLEKQGFLGSPTQKVRIGGAQEGGVSLGVGGKRSIHAEATGFAYKSGSGLKGERSELENQLENTKLNEKQKLVIQAEVQAVDKAIRNIQDARKTFGQTVKGMQGDVSLGMTAINGDLVRGLGQADTAWGEGTKAWRPHAVEAMQGAVHAIQEGMKDGEINAEKGQKRISELLGKIHLIKGTDPFGLAKATADSFEKAEGPWSSGIEKWERELKLMEPAAAKSAIDSTNKLLQGWAQGHPKIEAQIKSLTNFEISHFGATNKQLREGVKKGATGPVAEAFLEAAQNVGGALGNIGTNTNAMLKALGLHDMVQFQAIVFGPSRMGGTQLNKEGGGAVAAGEAKHHNRAAGGSVRVPGQGLYDTVPLSVNGKMSAVVAPGEDLVVLNRHQRPLIDQAVANEYGVAGLPGFFNTFNREHYKASGGSVHVNGPRSTGNIGQAVMSKTAKAINAYFKAHEPKRSTTGVAGAFTGKTPAGVGTFQGFPIDNWIIPELLYAQAHGWSGSITSGYRTPAHSAELGFPNDEHTKTSYPGGAVDFGGMHEAAASANRAAFIAATKGYKGPKLHVPIGFVDDGHMSGTGHARGGVVGHLRRFAKGGLYTSSDVHTTGTLQPKEAAIAMLLGGFPPTAKVLAEGLGTIAAESNFALPNNAQGPGGHIGLWSEGTEGFPASAAARENPIVASKAAYANWKSTGGFEQAWGQWELEQSGAAGWRNYGSYMKVAEEVIKGVSTTGGGGGHPSKQSVIEGSKNYAKGHTHAGGTSAGFAPHKEIQAALKSGAAHAKNPTMSHGVPTSKLPSWGAGLPLYQREELEGRGTTFPERETILGNAETNAAFEAGIAGSALEKAKAAYAKNPGAATWGAVGNASSLVQVKRKAQKAADTARKLFEKGYIKHLTVMIKKINAKLAAAEGKLTMKQVAALQAKRAELVSLRASARGESQGAAESLRGYEEAGEAEAAELESESPLNRLVEGFNAVAEGESAEAGGEIQEVLERPWKETEAELALAGLTESTSDDLAALEKQKAIAQEKLNGAIATGNLDEEINWAPILKGVEESIKGLSEGGEGGAALTEEIKALRETIEQQTKFAEAATATSSATAWKALADIMSGNLGPRANLSAQTAGNGSVGTF